MVDGAAQLVALLDPWLALPAGTALGFVALWVHTRWLGFLPEDVPTPPRKLHGHATPQAGFLFGGGSALWLAAQGETWLAVAIAILAVTGYLDDRTKPSGGLDWKWKAGAIVLAAGLITDAAWQLSFGAQVLAFAFAFVVINATNFLDNQNGVATALGGFGLVAATGLDGPLGTCALLFLGFLPCNWPKARLFLGDGGAHALGGLLAAAALRGGVTTDGLAFAPLLAPTAILVADFTQVVFARVVIGVPPWVADRRHLTHIVAYLGVPRTWVMPVMLGLAALALRAIDAYSG